MKTIRLDIAMVEKGLCESRSLVQRLIMEGKVRVNDQVVLKRPIQCMMRMTITVAESPKYVSRGGEKLEGAFQAFDLDVEGWSVRMLALLQVDLQIVCCSMAPLKFMRSMLDMGFCTGRCDRTPGWSQWNGKMPDMSSICRSRLK